MFTVNSGGHFMTISDHLTLLSFAADWSNDEGCHYCLANPRIVTNFVSHSSCVQHKFVRTYILRACGRTLMSETRAPDENIE